MKLEATERLGEEVGRHVVRLSVAETDLTVVNALV